jgi:hypothetical protein
MLDYNMGGWILSRTGRINSGKQIRHSLYRRLEGPEQGPRAMGDRTPYRPAVASRYTDGVILAAVQFSTQH